MLPIAIGYKLAAIAAAGVLIASMGIWSWNKGYNQHKLEVAAATATIVAKHSAELVKKGIQHDLDQATITSLAASARRLQVKFPSCPSSVAAANPDLPSRVLHNPLDEAFGRLQEGVGELIQACDALNNAAIRTNPK